MTATVQRRSPRAVTTRCSVCGSGQRLDSLGALATARDVI
jgi:hypothetical protein